MILPGPTDNEGSAFMVAKYYQNIFTYKAPRIVQNLLFSGNVVSLQSVPGLFIGRCAAAALSHTLWHVLLIICLTGRCCHYSRISSLRLCSCTMSLQQPTCIVSLRRNVKEKMIPASALLWIWGHPRVSRYVVAEIDVIPYGVGLSFLAPNMYSVLFLVDQKRFHI